MFVVAMQQSCAVLALPFVSSDIQKEFHLSDESTAMLATAIYGGSSIGVHFIGNLCDSVGRWRATMMCVVSMISLSALQLSIASGSVGVTQLFALWLVLGMPYGGLLVIVPAYISELVSDESRGYFIGLYNLAYNIGSIYAIACLRMSQGTLHWRGLLAVIPLPLFMVGFALLLCVPESPRWLMVHGRKEEAKKVYDTIFQSHPVLGAVYVGPAPNIVTSEAVKNGTMEPAERFKSKDLGFLDSVWQHGSLVFLCSLLYVLMAGSTNAIWFWEKRLLEKAAGGTVSTAIFQQAELAGIMGTVASSFGMDIIGRQPILIGAGLFAAVQFFLYSMGVPREAAIFLWWGGSAAGSALWTVLPVYIVESFPTMVRASLTGFCFISGRVASIVMPSMVAPLLEYPHLTFSVYASLFLAFSIGCFWLPRETKGRAMSDV